MSERCNPLGPLAVAPRIPFPGEEPQPTPREAQDYLRLTNFAGQATVVLLDLSSPPTPVAAGQLAAQFYGSAQPILMLDANITVTSLGFGQIFSDIESLSAENEVPPTAFAFLKSRSTVGAAYGMMFPKQKRWSLQELKDVLIAHEEFASVPTLPTPVVVTDDVGGIRFAWRKGNKTVRANFGADENLRSYVYFESDVEHGVAALDAASLSDRLNWLIKG